MGVAAGKVVNFIRLAAPLSREVVALGLAAPLRGEVIARRGWLGLEIILLAAGQLAAGCTLSGQRRSTSLCAVNSIQRVEIFSGRWC